MQWTSNYRGGRALDTAGDKRAIIFSNEPCSAPNVPRPAHRDAQGIPCSQRSVQTFSRASPLRPKRSVQTFSFPLPKTRTKRRNYLVLNTLRAILSRLLPWFDRPTPVQIG